MSSDIRQSLKARYYNVRKLWEVDGPEHTAIRFIAGWVVITPDEEQILIITEDMGEDGWVCFEQRF